MSYKRISSTGFCLIRAKFQNTPLFQKRSGVLYVSHPSHFLALSKSIPATNASTTYPKSSGTVNARPPNASRQRCNTNTCVRYSEYEKLLTHIKKRRSSGNHRRPAWYTKILSAVYPSSAGTSLKVRPISPIFRIIPIIKPVKTSPTGKDIHQYGLCASSTFCTLFALPSLFCRIQTANAIPSANSHKNCRKKLFQLRKSLFPEKYTTSHHATERQKVSKRKKRAGSFCCSRTNKGNTR